MRWLKTIFFSFFALLVTHFAVGQGYDELASVRSEPFKWVKLYPNPATDFLSIKFEKPEAKTIKLTVHDIIGNELSIERDIIDDHEIHLKVKDLPVGMYLLAVENEENQRGSFKFLKR